MKRYNIFIFFSSFGRNLIELYLTVFLYNKGYSVKNIFMFHTVFYFSGIFVNIATLKLDAKINSKYLLIISSTLYVGSYLYMSNMNMDIYNLFIFAFLLSLATFSYHPLRHYYAIINSKNNKDIGNILIFSYLALVPSSFIGAYITKTYSIYISVIVILVILFVGTLFLTKIDDKKRESGKVKLGKRKVLFFITEQYKVLYLTIFPLYFYINIDDSTLSLGFFNLLVSLFAVIFIFVFSRLKNNIKYFSYCNILFCLLLYSKLYISSKGLLIIIAILEGIAVKMYEIIDTINLYDYNNSDINKYIMISEIIFLLTRSISCFIFMFISLKVSLMIMIVFILISGFIIKK